MRANKKAAIELSISTIVVIVIAMTMLILGIVLVRQVMCSGIILTEEVTTATENEIKSLFGSSETGIKCMGEGGNQVTFGGGGRRQVVCIINEDRAVTYTVTYNGATLYLAGSTTGISGDQYVLKPAGGTWSVSAGQKIITVAVLDVPRDISNSEIKLDLQVRRTEGATPTINDHTLYLSLVPSNAFKASIC